MPQSFVKVAQTDDLAPGEMKLVEIGDEQILLCNIGGQFHAVSDVCTHAQCSLSEGYLDDALVECPRHGSVFDVRTGQVRNPPADEPLPVYQVRVQGKDVLVGPAKK